MSGFTLIFLALWALLDPRRSYVLDLVDFSEDEPLLKAAVYMCIIVGVAILLVGFIACCGAIKKSRCMLTTFVIFVALIFCAECVIGALAISYRSKFDDDWMSIYVRNLTHSRYERLYWVTPLIDAIQYYVMFYSLNFYFFIFCLYGNALSTNLSLKEMQQMERSHKLQFLVSNFDVKLVRMMRDEYGIRLNNPRNNRITQLIDRLQFYEECCGSKNATNWEGSRWKKTSAASLGNSLLSNSAVAADFPDFSEERAYAALFSSVPVTCCVQLSGATPVNPVARSMARCQQPQATKWWRYQVVRVPCKSSRTRKVQYKSYGKFFRYKVAAIRTVLDVQKTTPTHIGSKQIPSEGHAPSCRPLAEITEAHPNGTYMTGWVSEEETW
ncbi:unnamed protein product [Anisakis simplex]|uniref:Tetraspanin n=1 Tax=Anisakis simplex TaxID=6269 RepID=A0A0M3JR95_ANISI|nr:unnamed protein product [Anisakis simplex]